MSLQYITHTGLEQSWHFLNCVKGSEITWLTTAAVRNTKNVWSNDGGLFFLTFLDFRPPYLYCYEGLKLSNQLGSYFLDPSTKYLKETKFHWLVLTSTFFLFSKLPSENLLLSIAIASLNEKKDFLNFPQLPWSPLYHQIDPLTKWIL